MMINIRLGWSEEKLTGRNSKTNWKVTSREVNTRSVNDIKHIDDENEIIPINDDDDGTTMRNIEKIKTNIYNAEISEDSNKEELQDLLDDIKYLEDQGVNDKDIKNKKEEIQNAISGEEEEESTGESIDGFQGRIKIRRVSPNKSIGEVKDTSAGVISTTSEVSSDGLGTKQDIDEELQKRMEGKSMKGLTGITYDDLSYLKIPYYDFDGNVQTGEMVVNKKIADEVLLIFQELYQIKYPIQKMVLIDEYDDEAQKMNSSTEYGNRLDYCSIEENNTSAFNDRNTDTGTASYHGLGQAIDINPMINPYIYPDGSNSHANAKKFAHDRKTKPGWTETEKAAAITSDSEIYNIFTKYGWVWLGSADDLTGDTQHFEKQSLDNVATIDWANVGENEQESEEITSSREEESSVSTDNSGGKISEEVSDYVDKNAQGGAWSIYAKNLSTGKVGVNLNDKQIHVGNLTDLFVIAEAQQYKYDNENPDKSTEINRYISDRRINEIIDIIGLEELNKRIQERGYTSTVITKNIEENYSSLSDLVRLVGELQNNTYHTWENNTEGSTTLNLLMKTERSSQIAMGLPNGVNNVSMIEEIGGAKTEITIVYKENATYVLAISTIDDNAKIFEELSAIVYENIETASGEGSSSTTTGTEDSFTSTTKTSSAINAKIKDLKYVPEGESSGSSSSGGGKGIIVLDPGHGTSISAMSGADRAKNGFVQNSSGEWGEWRHWKSGTYGEDCEGSGCSGAAQGVGEWYSATSGDRDTEPEINLKNALAAKKYLEEMGYTVRMTREDGNSHKSFSLRSEYCFPNQDTTKEPDADLYVCIHSNASGAGASGTSYMQLGDENRYTQKYIPTDYAQKSNSAGSIINNKIAESTGLKNNGAITGQPDLIAFHKNTCPTAYLEIGFYDNSSDLAILNSKSDEIGKAIAEGVDEYMGHPEDTEASEDTQNDEEENKENQTQDLSYVTEETFNYYVENNDQKALDVYTLDESGNLITAKWSYSTAEGLKISKNSPINFKTVMKKYVTKYEYLLDFLIDVKDVDFINDFIDMVYDSEFIIAIQDNVSTTQVERNVTYNGQQVDSSVEVRETVSDTIELTYADTWFVRFEKEVSYTSLNIQASGGGLSGKKGQSLGVFRTTGYCPCYECSEGYGTQTASGAVATPNRTIAVDRNVIPLGTKVIIDGFDCVFVAEDVGGGVNGNHIDIYVENHDETFGVTFDGREVFLAEDVEEKGDAAIKNTNSELGIIANATANVKGKVTNTKTVQQNVRTTSVKQDGKTNVFTTVITTTTTSISNKFDTGETKPIQSKEDDFIELFENNPGTKANLKPKWIIKIIERNCTEMVDLTKFLINELFGKEIFDNVDKDKIFEKFKNNEFAQIGYGGTDISLTESVMDKETFVTALQAYYDKTGNLAFKQNFLSRAEEIYDLGVKYNVNPELIVTMALKESGFKSSGGNQNFWGLGTPNGASLKYIGSFEEGVKELADTFASYMEGSGTWQEQLILQRYEERAAANCNSNGYGKPGTLKGMLSVYSDLCGEDTKHREGDWGSGGNIYLKEIYGDEFEAKCGSVHKIGVDDYTIQERADYTAWLYEQQLKYWNDIFGEFASLGGGGTIVQEAVKLHQYIRTNGYSYGQGGVTVPNLGGRTIDCSSYVTWVLVNAGVENFVQGMYQWTSWTFEGNQYGWQEVSIDQAQPGDIVTYNGHVEIIADPNPSGDRFIVYNCGGNASINAEGTSELPESSTSGYSKSSATHILRVPQ